MKLTIYFGVVVAFISLLVMLRPDSDVSTEKLASHVVMTQPEPHQAISALDDTSNSTADAAPQNFDEASFVAELRARFAPHLHIKHAQIRTLEQLMSYLKQRYPQDWESRVLGMLETVFPDQAQELYQRFLSLQQYSQWLTENRDQLRRLSASARRTALWEARELAFGVDAQDIWAAEKRSQDLGDALASLPEELAPVERAQQFLHAVEQVYGDDAQELLAQKRTELINHLLDEPSLQSNLRSMPASQRRETLSGVRAAMGMPEDALQRWQQLDLQRDQIWESGQLYAAKRQALLEQYPNDAQWRISELQDELLGDLAGQLRQEEQSGFYRYANARRIGRE
ncbi:MAG: hypothetical protein ACSHXK_08555 [Oceanococcus sp.]